ncbi:hypothetical protein B0H16DRAFT_40799 [Mycena metata]|uniref:Uncharacterized protein n=1 Tax=Mycena metata TaxID=1033252 RepID=A0AAD7P3H4_9AGAR|nr:hypothetical protein B0H16DRAFT_327246 [Mycena metata]KAJ7786673.1 hypothetical protein B0H16DRAFT_40799 [Mycena metata]
MEARWLRMSSGRPKGGQRFRVPIPLFFSLYLGLYSNIQNHRRTTAKMNFTLPDAYNHPPTESNPAFLNCTIFSCLFSLLSPGMKIFVVYTPCLYTHVCLLAYGLHHSARSWASFIPAGPHPAKPEQLISPFC